MQTIILAAVLGGIVTASSCKSVVKNPESQPELFGSIPKFVKAFLNNVNRPLSSFKTRELQNKYPKVLG